jgi:hypothetical protein
MKKKHIYIALAILLILVLFIPFSEKTYPDGTRVYSAIFAKYISWHHLQPSGYSTIEANTLKIYFFPENQTDFETLREEFFASRSN